MESFRSSCDCELSCKIKYGCPDCPASVKGSDLSVPRPWSALRRTLERRKLIRIAYYWPRMTIGDSRRKDVRLEMFPEGRKDLEPSEC